MVTPNIVVGGGMSRQIMAQAFGIVHVIISGKPSEHRLTQQPDQSMAAVPWHAVQRNLEHLFDQLLPTQTCGDHCD